MAKLLVSLIAMYMLIGCNSTDAKSASVENAEPKIVESTTKEQVSMIHGTVRFMNLEGGFYGIMTKDGRRLLPMNLKKEFRQDGAIIKFTGDIVKGVMTIQQWGTPFKLEQVELVKAGNVVMNKDL